MLESLGVSMQPQRIILPHGLPDFGADCHACLSCEMVVLLVMPGCCVFHILMEVGRDDCFISCADL